MCFVVLTLQDSNNLYYVLELCRYGTLWDLEKCIVRSINEE